MKDIQKLMKQYQKMQDEMLEQQSKLEDQMYEASAGGGMVVAKVTGKMELASLAIRKECIDPDDPGMLQDLVVAAVNEAMRKAKQDAEKSIQSLTSGLASKFKIPGMP